MKKYIPIIILMIISILNLYIAKDINAFYDYYFFKQSIFYLIGFLLILFLRKKNLNVLFKYSKIFYIINILLLLIVLIIGVKVNGSRAWINLKIFNFQPSEFMKLTLTLFMCEYYKKKSVISLFIYTLIPSILVFIEPDTGAIIFYFIILLTFLIYKKINIKYYIYFGILCLLFVTIFTYLYLKNQDLLIKLIGTSFFYRIERIINFKNGNYQLTMALSSIFSSKIVKFTPNYVYIPENTTDFIFAYIIGNFGLISVIIIFLCYFFLIKNILKLKQKNSKTKCFTISFTICLLINILINVSMNIGLIPTIGITLPFLSYGGSSIILLFLYLAIIFNMDNNRNKNNFLMDNKD